MFKFQTRFFLSMEVCECFLLFLSHINNKINAKQHSIRCVCILNDDSQLFNKSWIKTMTNRWILMMEHDFEGPLSFSFHSFCILYYYVKANLLFLHTKEHQKKQTFPIQNICFKIFPEDQEKWTNRKKHRVRDTKTKIAKEKP